MGAVGLLPDRALVGFRQGARHDGFQHDRVAAQFPRETADIGDWAEGGGAQSCAFALEGSFSPAVIPVRPSAEPGIQAFGKLDVSQAWSLCFPCGEHRMTA
jgi:hypothetical protein